MGRHYMTLSYPVTLRSVPTNFNPAVAWSVGIQMAAIMLGAGGCGAALAHAGRFAQDNGGCGYVLKPPHLRPGAHADDDDDGSHDETTAENSDLAILTLKLRVL